MFIRILIFLAALSFIGCGDNIKSYAPEKDEERFETTANITSNGAYCNLIISLENGRRTFELSTGNGVFLEDRKNTLCLKLQEREPILIIKRDRDYFWKTGDEKSPLLIPLN